MPALDLVTITQLFETMATAMTKPSGIKNAVKRRSRQTIALNCVSDEHGGDTFTLKYTRKPPNHDSPYCDRCGDHKGKVRGKSAHAY